MLFCESIKSKKSVCIISSGWSDMNWKILLLVFVLKNGFCLAEKKPHVLVIVVDDWGWNDYGMHSSVETPTPNIDALTVSGISFTNYYTMHLCTPSRAALMTGMHPVNLGMQHDVLNAGEPWGLPLGLKLLPEYLKDDGYKTYAVGKWHLGDFKAVYTPTYRGFDSHFGYWEGRQDYITHIFGDMVHEFEGYDMRRGLNVSWESYGRYATDLFTDEAINIIQSHDSSKPMFLYVAHLAVHAGNFDDPVQAPDDVVAKFWYIKNQKRRKFAAMIWKLDDSVGKIIAALGHQKMLQDTIIVLTTDNGGAVAGYDNSIGSNWPLRGSKGSLWEGGVRGNAVIWSPKLPASKIDTHLMHIKDWLPTILAAVNSTHCQGDLKLDGYNMWPVLKGERRRSYDKLILNKDPIAGAFALRKGNFKIVRDPTKWNKWYFPTGRSGPPYNLMDIEESLVAQTFRAFNFPVPSYNRILELRQRLNINCTLPCDNAVGFTPNCGTFCATSDTCLYDLKTDPCERDNLAEMMPDTFEDMLQEVEKIKYKNPINKPWDKQSNPAHWNGTYTHWCDFVKC